MPRTKPSPQMQAIRIQSVGGVNYNDPSDVLAAKAFEGSNQIAPMEFQDGHNMDFSRQLLRMRYGSTAGQSIAAVMQAGEVPICGGVFYENVQGGTQIDELIIGTKSIYINRWTGFNQGTWAQINNTRGAAYLHNNAVAKASIVAIDGHAMLMLDGSNSIQVYRTGTALDNQLNGSGAVVSTTETQTTNNISGNSTGATIAITGNIANAVIGDRIHIHDASHDEFVYITAITLNTSVTVSPSLVNTYTTTSNTGSTPAVVTIENLYTQSFGGATQIVTGTWGQGYYMGMSLQGRFAFSSGNVVTEFCGPSNPWDRFNGGALSCDGPIVAMEAFTPRFANLLGAVGVFHTANENAALQFLSGFDPSATMSTIVGASPPVNYQSVCQTMNWIMYLTRNRRIEATDLTRVIDVGRRLRGQDSDAGGPLNTMNLTAAASTAFAFYDSQKRQAQFYFPDHIATTNTDAMVLDMQLGEPAQTDAAYTDTGSYAFEQNLRMLYWVNNGELAGTPWFTQMYQRPGSIYGILSTGQLYITEQPNNGNDLDIYPIPFDAKSPDFVASLPGVQKKWRRLVIRTLTTSNGLAQINTFLDRAVSASSPLTFTFNQVAVGVSVLGSTFILGTSTLGGGGIVGGHDWLDCVSEALAFQIVLATPRPTGFILSTLELSYQPANLQD